MSDTSIDEQGFRANVGIVILDKRGRVFLGRRTGARGWQFPQGGIEPAETPHEAMFRELYEETGLRPEQVDLLGSTRGWLRYRIPDRFLRRNCKPLCIGQKQRWFLLRLKCEDSALCLDATGAPEFDDWCWVSYWHPLRRVIYFKRGVYARALRELSNLLPEKGKQQANTAAVSDS